MGHGPSPSQDSILEEAKIFSRTGSEEGKVFASKGRDPATLWLYTEHQTIRRLPVSRHLLFTVRPFKDPLSRLSRAPKAADVLSRTIGTLSESQLRYKDLDDEAHRDRVVSYLASLASAR